MATRSNTYVKVYFLLVFLLGVFIFKDYGVSWDESIDRINGMVNAKYIMATLAPEWTEHQLVFTNVPDFAAHLENDHGALFHLPLAFMEVVWPGLDSRTYYLVRHFCIFLTFLLALWSVYKIALVRFKSQLLGLLTSALLLLSPRIFADGFYNGKDLVFLSFFTFGIYTLIRLLERPTLARAALHGFATAIATDVRILGCLLFALSIGMFMIEAIWGEKPKAERRQLGKAISLYCVVAISLTVVGWPYLWEDPAGKFLEAFDKMKRFRWEGDVYYLGQVVKGIELPWHYAPVWIAITTPVAYSLAFLAGAVIWLYTVVRYRFAVLRALEGRIDVLLAGWFSIPLLMVILLHSVIYDGWRHLYFIYPAFLVVAVRGAYAVWQASKNSLVLKRATLVLAVLAGAEAVYTAVRMVAAHPNQQVFFSFLSPEQVEQLFDRDYWGVAYRQGLEWISTHDTAAQLTINAPVSIVLENNLAILKPADRARFKINGTDKERYYLTAYRMHPEAYPDTIGNEVYTLKTNGIKILSVFYRW
ncbi:hypothetical protein J0X19_23250 [Hymenobacter sp. BT186]|uniref:Glycosyltransferase RgtA/B/C/D-like domain-containing protein n=2 Tax=Hymenobacter telluris TaxID=2816474 RepID=A0A939JD54_9BACT|nr:hypothetical protein [Hymenobacter telluris]MBW3376925.1 hypothetical protein [Hymenobacter norwichensis]